MYIYANMYIYICIFISIYKYIIFETKKKDNIAKKNVCFILCYGHWNLGSRKRCKVCTAFWFQETIFFGFREKLLNPIPGFKIQEEKKTFRTPSLDTWWVKSGFKHFKSRNLESKNVANFGLSGWPDFKIKFCLHQIKITLTDLSMLNETSCIYIFKADIPQWFINAKLSFIAVIMTYDLRWLHIP